MKAPDKIRDAWGTVVRTVTPSHAAALWLRTHRQDCTAHTTPRNAFPRALAIVLGFLGGICVSAAALAQPLRPLEDSELSKVSGKDGISLVADIHLNEMAVTDSTSTSHLSIGFKGVDGKTNHLVFRNPHGVIGIYGVTLDVVKRPDGGPDYVAVGLPGNMFFSNVGVDSINAQDNPATVVPFDQTLGGLNINGRISMTGQLRLWAH